MPRLQEKPVAKPARATVLGKAVARAADHLALTNRSLAQIVGLSEASISRLRAGGSHLLENAKTFELATLFVRLYRSLDAITGGDDRIAAQWLRNTNTALAGTPIEMIQSARGLVRVVDYLDARRALL
jgi:hypothetical protein